MYCSNDVTVGETVHYDVNGLSCDVMGLCYYEGPELY